VIATVTTPSNGSGVWRDGVHRYWFPDRREAIGVTAALKAAGLIDDRYFSEQATERGTAVHLALEALDKGHAPLVAAAHEGYIAAYRRFLTECAVGPIAMNEAVLGDPVLGYAGTVDRVRTIGPHLSVVDIKTGAPVAWHRIQLSAYCELVKKATHHAVVRRWGLYLREEGTYSFLAYTDRSDWDVFKAALLIAQYKGNNR
jgi:hypothetical protein